MIKKTFILFFIAGFFGLLLSLNAPQQASSGSDNQLKTEYRKCRSTYVTCGQECIKKHVRGSADRKNCINKCRKIYKKCYNDAKARYQERLKKKALDKIGF